MPTETNGPLHGIKVLDLTAMLAGPYATMLLADLGADVVKVEPPDGDNTRAVGPFRDGDSPEGLAGYFQSINRGKKSVVLNLRAEQDKATFLRLVEAADVVVENYSAGVMGRLGLNYEVLAEINPRLVYGTLRGFGDPRSGESPYTNWPAFDVVAQAMGGFLGITGTPDGTPIKSGPGVGDIFPGTLLALGIVSAVRHAEHTGLGQFVDIAMYDAVLALCERAVYQHSYTGAVPKQQGNSHPLLYPFDIMQTADGWIAVAANKEPHWRILVDEMGHPELATDPRYATNADRAVRNAELRPIVEPWIRARSNADLVALFGGRIPIGPVNSIADIFGDPHAKVREMLVQVEQPGSAVPVTIAGAPIKLSATPAAVRRRAPLLGEQNPTDILNEWIAQTSNV
ncbi:crotonobetainyl-CoA:carnitine CoA-transferase CaiB-like acyl-CoA transferase [Antricoccus suffuscus]|uniref:Crotonobetainyl-CoA:carnitine CoA-transferase CaiB-like acyl-CoA transferase n=1 Tax=Antricoccus suffuscus TaxID=1629062 RepID=A0A2T1A6N4_9ACTN|nr:CoA transferase [Antricoccus suffuscus]PRZ44137.1 crotonobetainyl-CoA:carnitine CoA-transferase CaiB-like acyl-CoA transferase [Antricoccus suffuscus]